MDVVSSENYLTEAEMQKPPDQEGAAVLLPQRKVSVTH
jgi:hypothetical protein